MRHNQLHVISTGQQSMETLVKRIAVIHPYIDAFHLREKLWSAGELVEAVEQLVQIGMPLEKVIINDRVDVAHVLGAQGVQLAHHSLDTSSVKHHFPSLKIGCSIHCIKEAIVAEKRGADYLLYGHIFPTASKPGIPPRGVENLTQLTTSVAVPVVAIGGITPENTREILTAGAKGIAVLSGILLAKDPLQAVKNYRKALQ